MQKKKIIKKKQLHLPAPRINMHFWIVFFCIAACTSVCRWWCIIVDTSFILCSQIISNHSLPALSVFTHISIPSSPIWLQPNHKKLHLNGAGGLKWEVDTNFNLSGWKDGLFTFQKRTLWYFVAAFWLQLDSEHINHQILESSGQLRLHQSRMYFTTFPLPFCLHLPLFLCSLVSMSSLTSSYFWLSPLFGSSHPSIQLAGWPKSCAVLELCSGRCKLSVALCSHAFPPLSSCSHCVCVSQEESEGCGQANEKRGDGEEAGQKRVSHGKSLQVISQ